MNRITSFLALSAIVVAGAFAGTAAQASANVNVNFKIHNGDGASNSMIRAGACEGIGNVDGMLKGTPRCRAVRAKSRTE